MKSSMIEKSYTGMTVNPARLHLDIENQIKQT